MELVGNRAAAEYVGVKPDTWSAYVTRDKTAPGPLHRIHRGGHSVPVWTTEQLDEWQASRPGPGAPGRPRRKAAA